MCYPCNKSTSYYNESSNSTTQKSSSFYKYGYHPCIIDTSVGTFNGNPNTYYKPSSSSYYGNFQPCYSVNNRGYSYY